MDRRSFLKSSLLGSLGFILPLELSSELVIVDVKLSDDFNKQLNVTFGEVRGSSVDVNVEFRDGKSAWDYVILRDEDNREWTTQDNGKTWHCGVMSFDLDVD